MKKTLSALAITVGIFVLALTAVGCSRGGMMMNDGQMMEQMQNNPQMMQRMMQQMHKDPKMMQQMMEQMHKDPKMMQQMSEWMLANPEHCAQMAEHMSKNPEACRNMMGAMAKQMDDPAAGQQMMQHCEMMMKSAGSGSAAATPAPSTISPATPSTPSTSGAAAQEFTVNVTGSGFSPASLAVKKGQPVRIHFKRDDQPTCADEVVFADLNIRKKLPPNATTTVEVTPAKEGDLTFACGMNMLKGKLVVS